MRFFLFFCTIFFSALVSSAQVHKKFFDRDKKPIKDSTKASFYMLYQKETEDSVWSAVLLDKRNIPVSRGFYLDDDLTIQCGKFITYQSFILQKVVSEHHSTEDTLFSIQSTGFYVNGSKEGTWVAYDFDGNKTVVQHYENDELNGAFDEYYPNGKPYIHCYYVKGNKEGDAYTFWPDSSIEKYAKFWHGHIIDFKDYSEADNSFSTYPGFNFEYYVKRYLKKQGIPPEHGNVLVDFTVDKDGKLVNPKIKIGVSPILDKAIVEAIVNSPTWVPATSKKKKVEQKISLAFEYDEKQ